MHKQLVQGLIERQIRQARRSMPANVQVEQKATTVLVRISNGEQRLLFSLEGPNYDAEPFRLMALDPDSGKPLEDGAWPVRINSGIHSVFGRPFCCLRGLYEYYCHPSHIAELWDHDRYQINLETLLGYLLKKCGCQ